MQQSHFNETDEAENWQPCSLAQERFWVLDQLLPGNPALNIAVRWRLDGMVSTGELEQAFGIILARHEILRTAFADRNGALVQIVRPAVPIKLSLIDLTSLTEDNAATEMERASAEEARASFDLAAPPFLRLTLIRLRAPQAVLLVTIHHIVADGWSIGLLAEEMGEICSALRTGAQPALPPLSIAYGDYARRQRDRLASADFDADAQFWRHALAGMTHFALHTDFPRPAEQSTHGAIVSILLPRPLTDGFAKLGRRHGCTLFMTALAALYTLLHRYSGEIDIALGTQSAGRDDVDVESLVGLFINTLVLRGDLSGDPSFAELLERTRDLVADAFEHQQLPLERVIEIVAPKRDLSRNALFSVNFIFQRSFVENTSYGAFTLTDLPSRSAGALYDLNFFMVERPEGWRISCEYNTDLFEPATVERMIDHFRNLMLSATDAPDERIAALTMLSEPERHALLVEMNDTAAGYPSETLPALFGRQAAATPESVAITCNGRALSYAELDDMSSKLARHLMARGITGLVGVMLDRSVALPAALMGILKAGCAYVPLDPAYPVARLEQIIADAGLAGLVTRGELAERLPDSNLPCIDMDRLRVGDEGRLPEVSPNEPAYVIFTSGSTGRPKGVEIPHRALVNLLWAMRDRPGINSDDVLLAVTTISFDIAALELFLPLIVGARLVVATAEQTIDGRELLALMDRERVTMLQATPVTWELLIDAGWRSSPKLKMLCGGEALSRRLADQLLQRGGELWNLYGPTETTIWSAAHRIEAGIGPVPIGGLIANTQFYVVDARGGPVPAGAPGELLIGGDGVATGYLGRDDLTAARFVADRFRPAAGGRLYHTGDIVRMRRPGEFEYLGRTDHQVKLRGFRIELGEIEAAARSNPEVAEAIATVYRPDGGEPILSLYAVVTATCRLSAELLIEQLRRGLVETLPGYMQPERITLLERLPRTPNGKMDRQALPAPIPLERARSSGATPLDATERRLADIWQDVLGLDEIDKDADFFELGGHSLLAARLLVRIEAAFGQKISLASLFKAPSLAAMAQLLTQGDVRQHDFRQVVRLQGSGTRTPVIGINNTGIYFTVSKRLGPERPFTALQLFDPSFSRNEMPESFEAIAQQYVALIREVQPKGPYALLGWCVGGALAFEVARQLSEKGDAISMLALIDTWAPRYIEDLGRVKGMLARHSYRWQLMIQDWTRKRNEAAGLWHFIRNREFVRKLGRVAGRRDSAPDMTLGAQARYVTADGYDQWLLKYLQQAVKRYRPGTYSGEITIFRSDQEPHGLFLDPQFGWGNHTNRNVTVVSLPGDHFTIFTEPAVDQMAQQITDHLEAVEAQAAALSDRP